MLRDVILEGSLVRLEPLDASHFDSVLDAVATHPEVWKHIPYRVADRADVERIFSLAALMRAEGTGVVFATCVANPKRLAGSTSIRLVDPKTPTVEIGATWLLPAWQRTRANTEAKYLQLTHCFETLGIVRVELKTDALNERSRAAILRIGATEEGTFRRHMRRADGTLRDSIYFSILAEEWPVVKDKLERMLSAPPPSG